MSLRGKLLNGNEAFLLASEAISEIEQPIDICTAFLRSEALLALLMRAPKSLTGRILVRWRLSDFLAGASDFDSYEIALSHGLPIYMRLDFHGKVYSLPPFGLIVGSANATGSGLGLTQDCNAEICTLIECSKSNQAIVDALYASAIAVDCELLSELKAIFAKSREQSIVEHEWPISIAHRLKNRLPVKSLMIDQCFWERPRWIGSTIDVNNEKMAHDVKLLNILNIATELTIDDARIKINLKSTTIYSWLVASLAKHNGEMYFGQLAASLQSTLADEPPPSRKDVKELVRNLLEWVDALKIDNIMVDRPNHSQRIRLLK